MKMVMQEKMRREEGMLDPELLQEYSIKGRECEPEKVVEKCSEVSGSGVLSVKPNRNA